ncbi:polyhydroxyalkanoate depolymerase [Eilatimonas milleporae]|uniref:Polyhydroxyalkanoate depolymerase n=1 Tax=Eilatimonas milleporae TaxID=911205 RepID=A0A3M0CRL7_9PROT|nr:polyhydroxyalkanoate depolymerase [Eilatimonas milleporae]RMB12201.1 polyhydroxyalkanoate depolymerase [Eilatimonas milleporae]
MMLYTLYELQHAAFAPLRFIADQGQQVFSHPYNPVSRTPVGKLAAASFDMVEQLTRRYGKPKFGLHETLIDGKPVAVEEQVVSRRPFGQLRHFKRMTHRKDPRVLIVAPMSGHFSTLLRGTVEAMLPEHDVYITDWRDARDIPIVDGSFDLDDYIDYLIGWLEELGPNTHVMAVCQPAVPVYGAVSLMEAEQHPCTPPSMTLMGGPIDTRINPTEVNQLATKRPLHWFEETVITVVPLPNKGFMRKVYPGFLQLAGFMTMNLGDHVSKHQELFEHLIVGDGESADKTKGFYEEYRSVMDMTAEFYLQTIETVFQRHALPESDWYSRDRHINPENLKTTALLAVEGELDDISGLGQTKASLDISTNLSDDRKQYFQAPQVGHYGIFNGRRWRTVIQPKVRDFIRAHDRALARTPKASAKPAAKSTAKPAAKPAVTAKAATAATPKSVTPKAATPATKTVAKSTATTARKAAAPRKGTTAKAATPTVSASAASAAVKPAPKAAAKPAARQAVKTTTSETAAPKTTAPKTATRKPAVRKTAAPKPAATESGAQTQPKPAASPKATAKTGTAAKTAAAPKAKTVQTTPKAVSSTATGKTPAATASAKKTPVTQASGTNAAPKAAPKAVAPKAAATPKAPARATAAKTASPSKAGSAGAPSTAKPAAPAAKKPQAQDPKAKPEAAAPAKATQAQTTSAKAAPAKATSAPAAAKPAAARPAATATKPKAAE